MRKTLSLLLALVMVLSLTACAETGELSIKYDETTEISLSKEYEELKWESSDTAIATVENNMVKGVGPGQATLTATSNSKVVAKYTVSVEIVEIAEIFLQSDELEIKIGEAVDLTYSLFPTDASAYGLTYTSINPDIATVDENGHIEAVAVGKTNIVLSTASGKIATCQVIVKEPSAIEQFNEDEKLLFDVMVEIVLPSFYNAPAARIRKMEDLKQRRRDKQPLEYPSAGSTFKRPEGNFAGKLIMEAGLAGYRIGGASVSSKHCGFIINDNNATSMEIKQLIDYVADVVYEKAGIKLEPEVIFLGDF